MAVPLLLMQQTMRGGSFGYGGYSYGGGGGGGYDEDSGRCILCWVITAVVVALFVALIVWGIKWNKEESRLDRIPPVVYTIPRGHVTRVNHCYSSKHSYDCTITMSNGETWETDITDWPDEFFTPGTPLHWEIWTQEYRQKQFVCTVSKCYNTNRFVKGDDEYSDEFARGN